MIVVDKFKQSQLLIAIHNQIQTPRVKKSKFKLLDRTPFEFKRTLSPQLQIIPYLYTSA